MFISHETILYLLYSVIPYKKYVIDLLKMYSLYSINCKNIIFIFKKFFSKYFLQN